MEIGQSAQILKEKEGEGQKGPLMCASLELYYEIWVSVVRRAVVERASSAFGGLLLLPMHVSSSSADVPAYSSCQSLQIGRTPHRAARQKDTSSSIVS